MNTRRPRPIAAALVVLVVLVITILCVSVALVTLPHFRQLLTSRITGLRDVRCILYDRPPRTGSTTVARALERCMETRGITTARAYVRKERSDVISKMLSAPGLLVAAVRSHLYITTADVSAIRQRCHRLLYVTSTRTMKSRMESALKYRVSSGHGNRTITTEEFRSEVDKVSEDQFKWLETFLHNYPYIYDGEAKTRKRLTPHYVIRAEHLLNDTQALLESLRCTDVPASENIHTIETSSRKVSAFSMVRVTTKDAKHRRLTRLAEAQNANGLRVARTFW